ncbi:MAG: glycosyltransferase family 4 protein, partial [Verrucomicrobiales bacterium]
EEEVKERGLEGRVVCAGWTDRAREFLLAADLYLHPALYEGLPLAILEAMSAGLPCVVSKDIAAEADVFDEGNLIICRDDDDPSWTESVTERSALRTVAEGGRQVFEANFTVDAMVRGYMQRYRMALGKEKA